MRSKVFVMLPVKHSESSIENPPRMKKHTHLQVPWHTHLYRAGLSLFVPCEKPWHTHIYRAWRTVCKDSRYVNKKHVAMENSEKSETVELSGSLFLKPEIKDLLLKRIESRLHCEMLFSVPVGESAEFSFHLVQNGKQIKARSYEKNPTCVFDLDNTMSCCDVVGLLRIQEKNEVQKEKSILLSKGISFTKKKPVERVLQKRHSIDVFGSCPSTDWYALPGMQKIVLNEGKLLIGYRADMQSILSAMSLAVEYFDTELMAELKPHDRKVADINLNKTFFARLEKGIRPSEYLLMDCSVEVRDIIRINDAFYDSYIFYLPYLLEKYPTLTRIPKLSIFTDNRDWLKMKVREFCERIKKYYQPEKIIINKVFWLDKFVKNDCLCTIPEKHAKWYESSNFFLTWFYQELEENLTGCTVFEMPPNTYLWEAHPWNRNGDMAGVHYEMAFYQDFYRKLREKILHDEEVESLKKQIDELKTTVTR